MTDAGSACDATGIYLGGIVHGELPIAAFWLLNDALTGTVGHWIFPGQGRRNV